MNPDDPRTKKPSIADEELDSGRTVVSEEMDSGRTVMSGEEGCESPPKGRVDRGGRDPGPRHFGRFEVIDLLGKGGMGRVWRARDPQLDREVAVKEILGDHPELVARFQQEARAQARVHHPHVCTVYEVGEAEGRPFIAMELLEGQTLDRVARDLSLEDLVELMRRVADAVHAAHRKGLVHRDIKPANVMVGRTDDGTWWPWVTDFGLARELEGPGMTISGATLGTPSFMPPEQARGQTDALDARADVYSLGATLFAALAGRPPFVAQSSGEVILKVIQDDAPALSRLGVKVPRDLESIIVQCLEKDPERRYSGADTLAEDLGRFQRGEPVLARPTGPLLRAAKALRRHRMISALIGLVVVLAVVLGSAWGRAVYQGRKQADLATEFDQEVRYVEDAVRHAFTAPLHDVRDELQIARSRLLELEARVAAGGPLAIGPGHAALGRGYLSLHDYSVARKHLEKAWDQGTRHPEVAVAFGRVLAVLYHQRRAEVEWESATEREKALAIAKAELGDPARELLEQGRDAATEAPELVEAWLASCEERWQDAVRQSAAAQERLPWLYDALVLQGEAWREFGCELQDIGENEGAEEAFDSAEEALRRAVSFGRSDPAAFQSLCDLGLERAELGLFGTGGDLEKVVAAALLDCEAAATVDPDSSSAPFGKSALWVRLAEWLMEQQEDPTGALENTEREAREAMRLAPDDSDPSIRLASAAVLRAQYQLGSDQDPTEDLKRAVRWFEHAIEREPGRLEALANLGKAHWLAAGWESSQGGDPRVHYDRAVEAYGRAVEVVPESALIRNNLGATWYQRASWEIEEGLDATISLERAASDFENARSLSPGLALASLNLASMYSKQAEQEAKHGRDPMPAWDRAVEAYGRCLEIQPDQGVALHRFVSLWFKRGMYVKETGGDPFLEFDAAVAVAQRAWDATPDDGLAVQRLGVAFLKRAVWGAAFSDDFNRARELLLEAVESYSRKAGAIADLAEALAKNEDDMDKARRLRSLATDIRRAGAGDEPKP